jgi:phosphatidylinositol-3-phosphatase
MSSQRILGGLFAAATILLTPGCGGGLSLSSNNNSGGTPPPRSAHVFVVVEENHSFSQVIGNSSMPYFNGLAKQYGLATDYYADAHPSIGNYFMLTAGQIETIDDSFSGTVGDDNIVRELVKAGKTWRSYAEAIPNAGYTGGDAYPYLKHHNPFAYFTDVVGTSQAGNIVPFSQFSADLNAGNFADYSFIIPDALNDAHDGTLAAADDWLHKNIDPLIHSSAFQNNGVLIILFDESVYTDLNHIGGHVAAVVIGPRVKSSYQSTTFYQHQSTLRFALSTLGVNSFPGAAAAAPNMGEFLK